MTTNLESIGEIMDLLTMECSIFIPFVCKRCGKCCRKIGFDFALSAIDSRRAVDYLQIKPEEFINRYLGEVLGISDGAIHWKKTKPHRPCPVLEGENICSIYPARPGPCRAFPLFTDFGDMWIGCPGKAELRKTMKVLGRGIIYSPYPCTEEDLKEKLRKPSQTQWKRIRSKFLRTGPSNEVLRLFEQVNAP